MQHISPHELKQRLDSGDTLTLLDVREQWEFELCQIKDSIHIPLGELLQLTALKQLDPQQEIIAICHHGIRSQQAAMLLKRNGFTKVTNLVGGIHHWANHVEPDMARY